MKGATRFADDGRTGDATTEWSSAQDRFIELHSEGLEGAIDDEDLGGGFYTENPDGEFDISDLPACNVPEEDITATIEVDFSTPAAMELQTQCEPLRTNDLCWEHEPMQNARAACMSGP